MRKIKGSNGPYKTGTTTTKADKESTIVEVEGELQLLKRQNPEDYCPGGMEVENVVIAPTTSGHGKMTIRCIDYGNGDIRTTPTRITWKISMAEVSKDLKCHPHFDSDDDRIKIEKWLNTDLADRYDNGGNPQYVESDGTKKLLEGNAVDYVIAYQKGIESYVEYYPVIEKISYYKTLPGCSMNKNSTTSGTVSEFSANLGTWDVPGVKLRGYNNNGWFKSGDNYEQGGDLVWTRTEQWTWTPDGQGSDVDWIYDR